MAFGSHSKELSDTILVVEDDNELRELLQTALELEGYCVFTAHSGAVGVETAKTQKPDVILMDVMMPEMNGIEAAKILQRDENTKHIPIIMVTAVGRKEDIIAGLEAGAIDYVMKPFFLRELRARVKSILRFKEIYKDLNSMKEEVMKKEISFRIREDTSAVNKAIDDNLEIINAVLKDIYQYQRCISEDDMKTLRNSISNMRNAVSELSILDTLIFKTHRKVSNIASKVH